MSLRFAKNHPGSWNDFSRLATVESLVDHHTFAIDRSIFDSGDKLFIKGHFYSDKPPVAALWMAGWYQALQWATGLKVKERPDRLPALPISSRSGASTAGQRLELPLLWRVLLSASFGLSTVALTYTRHVNTRPLLC